MLHEAGDAWAASPWHSARDADAAVVVVVADQLGFLEREEAAFAADPRAHRISFGDRSLLTSHCIVLFHHYLDASWHEAPIT